MQKKYFLTNGMGRGGGVSGGIKYCLVSFNLMFSIYLQYTVIFTCFSEVIKMCSKGMSINCSSCLPLSKGWGACCPGWFILPHAQDLG